MRGFGFGLGYWTYLLLRYLRHRRRQKQNAASERERKSWAAVRAAAAKAHDNQHYSVPSPKTLVPPTKFPFPNEHPRSILPLAGRGEEDAE